MIGMDERDIDRGDILYMDLRRQRDVMVQVKEIIYIEGHDPFFIVEETMVPFEKHIAYASDLSMSARHLGD